MTVNVVEDNQRERSIGDGEKGSCCSWKLCWWNPPQEAVVTEFFNETSLHGLQYVGQPKRHILERIFWMISFIIGLIGAGFLVVVMYQRYENTPVVLSYQSREQPINTIPFPAITFCNMNQFSKKKVLEMERIAGLPTHTNSKDAKRNLTLINSFCQSHKTFIQRLDKSYIGGRATSDIDYNNLQQNIVDFLVENTIPCHQMFPRCMFHGYSIDCDKYFLPVITDFGKCCTFNMMPLPLMFKNPSDKGKENVTIFDNPVLGSSTDWNTSNTEMWSKWNYEEGLVFEFDREKYFPLKQQLPGKQYGLSILIDPLTDDFYCPMSDAEGMVFTLHKSIEIPNIREFPSVLDTNKEIYIKIDPDITFADPDVSDLSSEKRQCFYGKEKTLKLYRPYTRENCVDDCVADKIAKQCNCTYFELPRDEGVRICNSGFKSEDGKCIDGLLETILKKGKKLYCGHCLPLCEDIDYEYEASMVTLRNASQIWVDRDRIRRKEDSLPEWANHKISIVHFFFEEAAAPKLRKRLYGVTDLIANVGGILGLCLGFSALSLVELLYFVLVRTLWRCCNQSTVCGVRRRTRPGQKNCEGSNLQNVEVPPTS